MWSRPRILPPHDRLSHRIQALTYPPVNGNQLSSEVSESAPSAEAKVSQPWPDWEPGGARNPDRDEPERLYTELEVRERENQAREAGFAEGRAQERALWEPKVEAARAALGEALQQFQQAREQYFRKLEREVVSLTLAIARKILVREAQVDPLLLAGAVRVALDRMAEGTAIRLRVPAAEADQWRYWVKTQVKLNPLPEVVADPALDGPRCLLESEVGSADLSLDAQLKEIERGFVDLLALRDH